MAGLVGYVGSKQAGPIVLEGLKRLGYRGYDSASLTVGSAKAVSVRQADGNLRNLEAAMRLDPVRGTVGIGQTGWTAARQEGADAPRTPDAVPEGVLVALIGRLANADTLRESLPNGNGSAAASDTEVLAALIGSHLETGTTLEEAVRRAASQVEGNCALAAIARGEHGKVVAARLGMSVVIGLGRNENFVASEVPAILNRTRDVMQLEDGDIAVLTRSGVRVMGATAQPVSRSVHRVRWDPLMTEKSGYKHFMLKEIFEQPRTIRETVLGRLDERTGEVFLDELGVTARELRAISHLTVIGCGSSWHAALTAKAMIEQLSRVHVEIEYGSEFRYSDPLIDESVLTLVISQSGETADTLACQQLAHERGSKTIAVCNDIDSTIASAARGAIYTHAGPELAAASTKSFSAQLAALYLFAMYLGQVRGTLTPEASRRSGLGLLELPSLVEEALELAGRCERFARQIFHADRFLYLGRGTHYPIALEGARKLRELARIQADGCAAGEMRHGPTALVDSEMIVVMLATVDDQQPSSRLRYEKTLTQMQEVATHQSRVLCITNESDERLDQAASEVIRVPSTRELLLPSVELIPLQLLAYHVAAMRGRPIDQPRDTAMRVTAD